MIVFCGRFIIVRNIIFHYLILKKSNKLSINPLNWNENHLPTNLQVTPIKATQEVTEPRFSRDMWLKYMKEDHEIAQKYIKEAQKTLKNN